MDEDVKQTLNYCEVLLKSFKTAATSENLAAAFADKPGICARVSQMTAHAPNPACHLLLWIKSIYDLQSLKYLLSGPLQKECVLTPGPHYVSTRPFLRAAFHNMRARGSSLKFYFNSSKPGREKKTKFPPRKFPYSHIWSTLQQLKGAKCW